MRDSRIAGFLGRVLGPDGAAAGTCFQVAPGTLVTAWHVLEALERGGVGAWVDTDALDGSEGRARAHVVAVDVARDLAVLRRAEPLPAAVACMVPTDSVEPLTGVIVTGVSAVDDPGHVYRHLDATGTWQGGTVRDGQVALGRLASTSVLPGMSGAPVLRLPDRAVVGMVSARYNSADGWLRDSVWVARVEDLARLLAEVQGLVLGRRLVLGGDGVDAAVSVRAREPLGAPPPPDRSPAVGPPRPPGGPHEAALEAARVLTALDDACRGLGRLGDVAESLITGAVSAQRHPERAGHAVLGFRARLRAHGLDARVLLPGLADHDEALRRWAEPFGGAVRDAGEEAASAGLLAALRRALADEVAGPLFAGLSGACRRYLADGLAGGGAVPPAAFLGALSAHLPPLRSTSVEAVLLGPAGERPGVAAAHSAPGSAPAEPAADGGTSVPSYRQVRLTSVAAEMIRLPDPDPCVAGRDDAVRDIARRIERHLRRRPSATAFLSGQPGVGTSTVAIEAARRLAPAFTGGVFHVDLRGLVPDARRHARDVVRTVSEALGLDLGEGARDDTALFEAFAARLRGRHVLLVLDNALDARHVAPLAGAPATCAVIVTSRDRVQSYADSGLVFRVDPLARAASVEVLARCDEASAREGGPVVPGLLHRVARLCADVPMALRLFAARMAGRPDLPVDYLVQLLEEETTRLDSLDAGDRAVRAAIRLSYDVLDAEAAKVFRLVAAVPGTALTGPELGHCRDAPPLPQEMLLNRLVDRSLAHQQLVRSYTGRMLATFRLFDLVLLFAKERLAQEEPEDVVWDVQHRSVSYLRDRLREITDQDTGAELSGELDPARFHAAEGLAEQRGWLDLATDLAVGLHVLYSARGELDALTAVNETRVGLHLRRDQPDEAVRACLLDAATLRETAPNLAMEYARRAGRIAREHGLTARAAEADFTLSLMLWKQGELSAALEAGERAATVLTAIGKAAAAVPVAHNNCVLAREVGDNDKSLHWARVATDLADRWGGTEAQASAHYERCRAEIRTEQHLAAVASARRAEALYRARNDWWNAAVSCDNGAVAAERVGDTATAVELRSLSADHWERRGNLPHLLEALIDLGAVLVRADSHARAHQVLTRARKAAHDDPDLAAPPLLRAEAALRRSAVGFFLDPPSPDLDLPELPPPPTPDGPTDPELGRVRALLHGYARGSLSLAAARAQVHDLLVSRTRNPVPFGPLWLYEHLGEEAPPRTALGR